ncbi:MAG: hypothetical protein OCD02_21390 [Spirochaetaceae bacterium]
MNNKIRYIITFTVLTVLIPTFLYANDAIILEKSGVVSIQDSVEFYEAEIGTSLNFGDIISTGKASSAIVILSDGTRIDLFSSSKFVLTELNNSNNNKVTGIGKLWNKIKNKFSDVEYSNAQAGSVGAIRGSITDEVIFNDEMSEDQNIELLKTIDSITNESILDETKWQLKAIIFEEYGQFIEAEKIYLQQIESNPTDLLIYDMLIDLYFKVDFYAHASEIIKLKEKYKI